MKNVVISNEEDFIDIKDKIISEGSSKFHVVADFDRTLTKAFVNGKKTPSVISVLREEHYLSEEYSEKAKALAEHYHPLEIDLNLSIEKRKKYMKEWWEKHFELLIKSGLNKKNLERVVEEEKIEFREGALEFLDLLHEKQIPLIILSSSGIGDLIPLYLKKRGRMYDNIHIITNLYEWDEEGNATSVKRPIIHIFNKDEASIRNFPNIEGKIGGRKNVLLLGDSLGDLGMIEGFEYSNLLKVGFLNDKIEDNLERYKENFDVVLINDSNMSYVNDILKEIK